VEAHDVEGAKLQEIKRTSGVTPALESCHTARVGGYTIEGHVPAADIQKLLREKPAIVGLSVPGMPLGSPGMEVPPRQGEPFDSVAFTKDGKQTVFVPHPAR
jgi:hypothetical protein